jgi:hypothetical protein
MALLCHQITTDEKGGDTTNKGGDPGDGGKEALQ